MERTPTYAVLGMLATRSWTGYELTAQVRRSLRYVWPVSEGHLYREQKRLVDLGWATVTTEPTGPSSRRTRQRYAITEAGRAALADWLGTPPEEPRLHVEGILRAFYGDRGSVADLQESLRTTAAQARAMRAELQAIVEEYLEPGGPVDLLERGEAGEFHGREVFPERLPVVALAIDAATRLLEELDAFGTGAVAEVEAWAFAHDPALAAATRARLEAVRDRGRAGSPPEQLATRRTTPRDRVTGSG